MDMKDRIASNPYYKPSKKTLGNIGLNETEVKADNLNASNDDDVKTNVQPVKRKKSDGSKKAKATSNRVSISDTDKG